MLDFDALSGNDSSNAALLDPLQIFTTLARAARFKFVSANQGEVLGKWFDLRERVDNTVKMNTGSGKMLVGLLMLQSCMNEEVGPAVYITPDNYLARQVLDEARDLGIAATESINDADFVGGRSILVANIDKLVNGRSVFGVGSQGVRVPIAAIVVDDAHACLESVADQFSIALGSAHPGFQELLALFEDDLKAQSTLGLVEVQSGDPQALMPVPFWAWQSKLDRAISVLHRHRDSQELRFSWPLLKAVLIRCSCAFGGGRLEIAPRCLPIDAIPSFASARRRIYMTATLADDGVLISHLKADPAAVADPIRPRGPGEIGDRMIIAPQEVNPDFVEADIKALAAEVAVKRNVVVLVPSFKRADFWADVSDQTLSKDNIAAGVARLRSGHVGLTVLVNRYDGVDLPDDACRLLIVDGLPEKTGLLESIESTALEGTQQQLLGQIQRLEQGMGRGVRSVDDRCAVLLFGARLTQRVNQVGARELFTPATLVQLEMGREVTKQIKGGPIGSLRPILDLCMSRDTPDGRKWRQAGKDRLARAKEGMPSRIAREVVPLREAFDLSLRGQSARSAEIVQKVVRDAEEPGMKGYLMQQLAEYRHESDPVDAQRILLAAHGHNPRVLRPQQGVSYAKLSSPAKSQSEAAEAHMRTRFIELNEYVLWGHSLIADLVWDKDRTDQFESAMQDVGALLGFGSQRPDRDRKEGGPDNLWALGGLEFLIIECKSGVDLDTLRVSKDHCNQLLGAMSWFNRLYDQSCRGAPVLVHPSSKFQSDASPSRDMRVLDTAKLKELRRAIGAYVKAIGEAGSWPTPPVIQRQFFNLGLSASTFVQKFTVPAI